MNIRWAYPESKFLFAALALLCCSPTLTFAQGGADVSDDQLAEHQRRALDAEQKKDFTAAIGEYKILVAAVPSSAELKSNLGVAYYFHRDFVQAEAVLRKALALNPGLYTPHLFLGLSLAEQGRPAAAVTELERSAVLNPADPVAHAWLGYEYVALARFDRAVGALETAVHLNPDDQDAWFALGRCHMELGKATTMQLIAQNADGARVWELAGEQYEARGNNGKALELYTMALKRRPDLEDVRTKILALGGSIPETKPESQPDVREEDSLYARVQMCQKQAREAFQQISRIAPDSYRAHQVLGDAAAMADLNDEAIREYTMVLVRKPDLPGIHLALCKSYSYVARVQDAVRECEAELKLSPTNADACAEAARVSLLAGNKDHAQALLEKAVTLPRPPSQVYKLQGKLYLEQQKYREAAAAFAKYVAAEPGDTTAYYLLAQAYKRSGDNAGASRTIAEYRRRVSMASSGTEAEQALSARSDATVNEDLKK